MNSIALPQHPLPAWTPGTLDIHHISTGMGVATLFIFPDGTTMLLDAGELDRSDPRTHSPRNTPPHPNPSRLTHEWIAHYVRLMLPHEPQPTLDYALITHFHDDHMGCITDLAPLSPTGAYRQSGITGVGDLLPIRTLIDRGHSYPFALDDPFVTAWIAQHPHMLDPYRKFSKTMQNYFRFIEWQQAHNGMHVAQAQAGRTDQIVLRRQAENYPDLQIRIVCANGEVWTGQGNEKVGYIPPVEELVHTGHLPDENLFSIGVLVCYGPFRYWNGADIPGIVELDTPPWCDLETPVARAIGAVDVHVLNHHGYLNTHNEFYVRTLRPRVMVHQVWSADQPGHSVLRRLTSTYLYPGPRDLFATDMLEATRIVIGDLIDRAYKSQHGHVLVRVEPGGRYGVIVLDDGEENCPVKAVYGPYEAAIIQPL